MRSARARLTDTESHNGLRDDGMYLNTTKKINYTVGNRDARFKYRGVQLRVLDTPDIHLVGGTPEYKLKFGILHTKPHTLTCILDSLKGV